MQLEKKKRNTMEPENSSGQGNTSVVPDEILGWNWGASLLGWVWALGNNRFDMAVYGLAVYVLAFLLGPVGWFAQLVISLILGIDGTKWAWQNKEWRSILQFKKTQRNWAAWGIIALVLNVIMVLYIGISGFGMWHI